MKLTKVQQHELAMELQGPWAGVDLVCDGYLVSLRVERYKALSWRIYTYVNGCFRAAWVTGDSPAPEVKFLRKSVRLLFSPAKRKKAEKVYGKRAVAKDPFFNETYTMHLPDWTSGKAAIAHLCKVSDSIEVAEPEKAASMLAAAAPAPMDIYDLLPPGSKPLAKNGGEDQ